MASDPNARGDGDRGYRMGEASVILGGTGFLGAAIARAMVANGHDVTVVSRRPPAHPERLAGARVLQRDATDPATYDDILEGTSSVVYAVGCLSPLESNASPIEDIHKSLTPLLTLLDALRRRPEVRMLFISSGGTVYGNPRALPVAEDHPTDPTTSYGILKLAAEKYIGMYSYLHGVNARILRVANAYGPFQPVGRGQGVIGAFLDNVVHGRPLIIFGTGRTVRDYIHVDDIARAVTAAVVKAGPSPLNVGTGVGTSLLQLVDMMKALTGERVKVEHRASRGFDVESIVLDVSGFRALTGQEPIELESGIADAYLALPKAERRQ